MFSKGQVDVSYDFLTGSCKASLLLSSTDWKKTSLGEIDQWPLSLKATIRLILDNASPMYFLWGEEKIQFYNDAFYTIIGAEKFFDCMGKSAYQSAPDIWDFIEPTLKDVLKGNAQQFKNVVLSKHINNEAKECFVSLSLSPVRDDFGVICGAVVVASENTKQVLDERRLNKERERLRTIADRLPAFITYIGSDGKYKFINSTYAEWIGHPRSQIEGMKRENLVGDKMTFEYMEPYQKRAFSGEKVRFELFFSKPSGEYVVLDTEYLPDIDPNTNKVQGIICVGQNITERRKALLEAEKAQKEMREIFMQTPLPMAIMTGPEFIFTLANPHYVKFAGREVLNKPMMEAFSMAEVEKFLPTIKKVYSDGTPVLLQESSIKAVNKKGIEKEIIVNSEYHPYKDSMGVTIGVMIILHDVTEQVMARRKVEESEERYRKLTDTIPQLMWTATPVGTIDYVNKRCAQYSGLDVNKKFQKDWLRRIHSDDLPRVTKSWKRSMKNGKPFKEEFRIKRADGEYRWFLGSALPVKNSNKEILYWNGTATDIEDHKRIEAELESARTIAEKANKTKSAFLANMSHEIRTPLSAILGYSELLKNVEISSELRNQYFETINRNGKSLSRIIDDILDLAKVEAGRIDIDQIDFSFEELLKEVIDLMSQKANQKGINLSLNILNNVPKNLFSDPARLRQIFLNIIGNAVKFTEKGSVTTTVKAQSLENGSLKIFVEVEDTGRGLDEEQRERIFKPFSQADNTTTRQYGGTGLGLALSKRLSEAMGGTITIDRYKKDEGCTFVISFIAAEGKDNIQAEKAPEHFCSCTKDKRLTGFNILFADDSIDNQFLVEHFFKLNGANVMLANDGIEAVAKASLQTFDIILMDIQMPKMDGYEATKILLGKGIKTPIIALTAHAMDEEREKTRAHGFSGHLTKPFNFGELLQTVELHGILNTNQQS